MELRDILARNIRVIRAAQHISQEELGARAGLTRNFIGEIERAEKAATVDSIAAIAKGLGVSPSSLLDEDLGLSNL